MLRVIAAALLALACLPLPLSAERLGYGRLVTNDFIGDGHDRWRTGSIASSRVWGPAWGGVLPRRFGEIVELRLKGEIVAPDDLDSPAVGDRLYGTALSVGLHSHFQRGGLELALGADLVATGPMTGLDRLQNTFHDGLGVTGTSPQTRARQIADGLHPSLVLETGRNVTLGARTRLRPFAEARLGGETLLRAGLDLTIGRVGEGELLVRDPVSGQRYRVVQDASQGYAFVLGADVARVRDSVFLPTDGPARLEATRTRARAGLHWQGETGSAFYGVTWLSEEFSGQGEGQFVGSLRLNLDF